MASRPGIVLVHGAWHTPAHFANVVAKLETQGYQVQAPQSPSSNTVALDDVFALDVAAIKDSIRKITSAGKDAVVLMHSFGGVCGSEAVAEFLEEEKAGAYPSEHGTIIQLVYVCAVILPRNTSLLEDPNTQLALHLQGQSPIALHFQDGLLYNLEPYHCFYKTAEPGVAYKAMQLLQGQSVESFATKTKHQGWSDYGIPVMYISAKQDMALRYDPDLIKFVGRLKDAGVRDLSTPTLDCDHTPWLSAESEFMAVLHAVLEKYMEGSKTA